MHDTGARITAQGEAAVRVEFTDGDFETRWTRVHRFADRLGALGLPAVLGVATTYDSALVEFDPLRLSVGDLRVLVEREATQSTSKHDCGQQPPRHFRLPACYEGGHAPDLADVAGLFGIPDDELVERHAHELHRVWAYGAPAAAPLMDGVGGPVLVPRRESPRVRVPRGSLALAGAHSIIYTVPAPGGWQLIGRTPAVLVSTTQDPVCAYRPGDHISYFPITEREWSRYEGCGVEEFIA